MSVISQADSLMAIFGYRRVACRYCIHSVGTDKADMYCAHIRELVQPDSQCEAYMREIGSEGDQ